MLSIYDFNDYRKYLKAWIQHQPLKGHGLKGKMARAAGVSSTLISLILKGEKQFSQEQALEISEFIGHTEQECDYLLLLLEKDRAGSHKLKQKIQKKIHKAQAEAQKISAHVPKDVELSEEAKAIYYSDWLYTAIRNLVAIGDYNDIRAISQRLNVPDHLVSTSLDFLFEHALCRLEKRKIVVGPAHTHLDKSSRLVQRHHQNWRLKGFERMSQSIDSDLFCTAPMSLSAEAADEIRKLLPKLIESVLKIMRPSPSEKLYCFNMDWFEI